MEIMQFQYKATKALANRAHVGVVGSGDLEVLMEPVSTEQTTILVRTGTEGFRGTWEAVLDRFFTVHEVAAEVTINDFGATPGVVAMRLAQALEVSGTNVQNEK